MCLIFNGGQVFKWHLNTGPFSDWIASQPGIQIPAVHLTLFIQPLSGLKTNFPYLNM